MTTTAVRPSLDRTLDYTARWLRVHGRCRLRLFEVERLAVVTEMADNPGPSVTNAIECVAGAIEALLPGVRFADHRAEPLPASWQLIEHYERSCAPHTLDVVRFRGRDAEGQLVGPSWMAIRAGEMGWLREAIA